jgi:hypothetical protein
MNKTVNVSEWANLVDCNTDTPIEVVKGVLGFNFEVCRRTNFPNFPGTWEFKDFGEKPHSSPQRKNGQPRSKRVQRLWERTFLEDDDPKYLPRSEFRLPRRIWCRKKLLRLLTLLLRLSKKTRNRFRYPGPKGHARRVRVIPLRFNSLGAYKSPRGRVSCPMRADRERAW